jgi:glycosyltransferase involved in cell wall biosynthesis
MYLRVRSLPFKKALLFAGGPIEPLWVEGFDHLFIESQIDMDTCERFGLPHSRAFGVNEEIFKPEKMAKVFEGIHPCTCASWKRTWLMTEALGDKSVVCGRFQETDQKCWIRAKEDGAVILPEQTAEGVADLLNSSVCLVQTSAADGGGQRATLEALACGIPVIAMSDSPKNCEFVRESDYGVICPPTLAGVMAAHREVKKRHWDINKALKYMEKWSSKNYANAILDIITKL